MGRDEDGERQRLDAASRNGNRFVCRVCGAEFDSEAALRDHVFSQGQVY